MWWGKPHQAEGALGAPDEFQLKNGQSYRRDMVRKATSGQRGLGALMSWGPGKLLIRCSKESQKPSRVGLWASSWAALENEKNTTLTAIRVGVKILQFLFGLQLPLTCKPWVTLFEPLQIKWEVHIFIKKSSCVFIIVSLWCCRWQYNRMIGFIHFSSILAYVKCKQPYPGFELESLCPFCTALTMTHENFHSNLI